MAVAATASPPATATAGTLRRKSSQRDEFSPYSEQIYHLLQHIVAIVTTAAILVDAWVIENSMATPSSSKNSNNKKQRNTPPSPDIIYRQQVAKFLRQVRLTVKQARDIKQTFEQDVTFSTRAQAPNFYSNVVSSSDKNKKKGNSSCSSTTTDPELSVNYTNNNSNKSTVLTTPSTTSTSAVEQHNISPSSPSIVERAYEPPTGVDTGVSIKVLPTKRKVQTAKPQLSLSSPKAKVAAATAAVVEKPSLSIPVLAAEKEQDKKEVLEQLAEAAVGRLIGNKKDAVVDVVAVPSNRETKSGETPVVAKKDDNVAPKKKAIEETSPTKSSSVKKIKVSSMVPPPPPASARKSSAPIKPRTITTAQEKQKKPASPTAFENFMALGAAVDRVVERSKVVAQNSKQRFEKVVDQSTAAAVAIAAEVASEIQEQQKEAAKAKAAKVKAAAAAAKAAALQKKKKEAEEMMKKKQLQVASATEESRKNAQAFAAAASLAATAETAKAPSSTESKTLLFGQTFLSMFVPPSPSAPKNTSTKPTAVVSSSVAVGVEQGKDTTVTEKKAEPTKQPQQRFEGPSGELSDLEFDKFLKEMSWDPTSRPTFEPRKVVDPCDIVLPLSRTSSTDESDSDHVVDAALIADEVSITSSVDISTSTPSKQDSDNSSDVSSEHGEWEYVQEDEDEEVESVISSNSSSSKNNIEKAAVMLLGSSLYEQDLARSNEELERQQQQQSAAPTIVISNASGDDTVVLSSEEDDSSSISSGSMVSAIADGTIVSTSTDENNEEDDSLFSVLDASLSSEEDDTSMVSANAESIVSMDSFEEI